MTAAADHVSPKAEGEPRMATPVGPVTATTGNGHAREWRRTVYLLLRNPVGLTGLVIVAIFLAVCLFGPLLAPYDPYAVDMAIASQPPGIAHVFGTDLLGRDILSRLLTGAWISFLSGLIIVGVGMTVGIAVGLIAGYYPRTVGPVLMRLPDIFLAFPTLVLAIALTVTFGPSLSSALLAMSLVYWPSYSRLMYGETLAITQLDYVRFARTLNQGDLRIMRTHVLPNALPPSIIQGSLDFGDAILLAAVLGFLGLGAQPPSPEWGAMVAQGRNYLFNYWWMSIIPGLAIFIVTLGFNFLGDGIRDALDPTLRRERA
jgi:peptide/nickel transport system permease protein